MKIGVLGSITKVKNEENIKEILAFFNEAGYETVRFFRPNEIAGVDVVVVLGGDGALLHASVIAAQKGIKLIGVNYGHLGFLTEYEKEDWKKVGDLLASLEKGECRILRRSILQIDIADKTFYALNEVAVQRASGLIAAKLPQIVTLELEAKEGKDEISGDGLLICTPTGSTAYSLSAGGAILTPEVPVIMVTPVCAFSMRTRPIVFADTDEFTVRIKKGKSIILADGYAIASLPENTEVRIKKAPFTADFPVKENTDFFARIRNKLNG